MHKGCFDEIEQRLQRPVGRPEIASLVPWLYYIAFTAISGLALSTSASRLCSVYL
jgi:hypothetical protein